jgi:hypothetical protein
MLNTGSQQQQQPQQQFDFQQTLPSFPTLHALLPTVHMDAAAATAAVAGGGAGSNFEFLQGLPGVTTLTVPGVLHGNNSSSTPADASMAEQQQAQQAGLWGQLQMDCGVVANGVLPVGPSDGLSSLCLGGGGGGGALGAGVGVPHPGVVASGGGGGEAVGVGAGVPHPGVVARGGFCEGQGGDGWLQFSAVDLGHPQWGLDSGGVGTISDGDGFGGFGGGSAGVGGGVLCSRKRPAHVAFGDADGAFFGL